jgi:HEAT repeat protein
MAIRLLLGTCGWFVFSIAATAQATPVAPPTPLPPTAADNPYRLAPYHADFPVALSYPPMSGAEYDRTRRQILERLTANLQGNVRREAWLAATEFFWRAPEDAVAPLIEAMDRAFGNPALGDGDVVKNCIEAMGRMGNEAFDAPLRRALQHKNPSVQQAAFAALATCGKKETLRELAGAFPNMDGRARGAWLRGVRMRLGADAVPILKDVMMKPYPVSVRDQVLQEALKMPPAAAAEILRDRWEEAVIEFKAIIAGVRHANGETAGTAWLRDSYASEDLGRVAMAIRNSAFGDVGELRNPLLALSTHLRPEIRLEVAKICTRIEGGDVADVYEVLAAPEESWEQRAIALRELTRRGRNKVVDVLLDELPTATGTRLTMIVNQLSASGDERAVPILVERFNKAPPGEGRPFLQGLAQNQSAAAAKAMFAIYRGEDRSVGRSANGDLTTRSYLPTLFMNLRGNERTVLAEFLALEPQQWSLRAALLPTLVGIAADRTDPELQEALLAPVRQILFDRNELPQMRVLALNLLSRRWLTIEDALKLRNTRHDEIPGLRALFADFLNDAF